MTERTEEMRKQLLEMWKKTVAQLEEISKTLMKSSGLEKLKSNGAKLLAERDKLLKRLGEETYRLIDLHKIKVPKSVQDIYLKIRNLMDRLIMQSSKGKPAKKTARKKATGKRTA